MNFEYSMERGINRFLKDLRMLLKYCPSEPDPRLFDGVNVTVKGGIIRFDATDGCRMCRLYREAPEHPDTTENRIFPAALMRSLLGAAGKKVKGDNRLLFGHTESGGKITFNNIELYAPLLRQGSYPFPDCDAALNKAGGEGRESVLFTRSYLKDMLDASDSHYVELSFAAEGAEYNPVALEDAPGRMQCMVMPAKERA